MCIKKISFFFVGLLFVACRGSEASNRAEDSLLGEAEAEIFNPTGYPIVKEAISLTTLVKKRSYHGNFEEMPTIQRWEDKAGINLEIQEVPRSQWGEKLNLLFASGDFPDISMAEAPVNLLGLAGNSILRLDPYIEAFMPNLNDMLRQRPNYDKAMREPDGNIYSLISIEEFPEREVSYNMFINKKWLDQLGLGIPATTDEFYRVLQAFKERDPNGNGIADELPLSYEGSGSWDFVITNSGAFMPVLEGQMPLIIENGKVEFTPLIAPEGYIGLIRYVTKLYREGLIDLEVYTQGISELGTKGRSGLLGSFSRWHPENAVGPERIADYVALPPLKGPIEYGGRQEWVGYLNAFYRRRIGVVSVSNPYPAATMRFLDMAYEPEFAWQILYGPWDILLNKDADGNISVVPPPEGSDLSADEWRFSQTPATRFPYGLLIENFDRFRGNAAQQRKIERAKIYKPYIDMSKYFPQPSFTEQEELERSVLQTDIQDFYKQTQVNWITQGIDPEAEWASFTQQLERIGLARLLEIYQSAYERYQNAE